MNYEKIYDNIIRKAQNRNGDNGYYETHHIIPRCMGGSDDKTNLVKLKAKEHFLCHLLLTKIYPYELCLVVAFNMMLVSSKHQNRITGKKYKFLKEKHRLAMSISQKGDKNSQYGTKWMFNETTFETKKVKYSEVSKYENNGWVLGRKPNIKKCIFCQSNFIPNMYEKFCNKKCKDEYINKENKKKHKKHDIQLKEIASSYKIEYGSITENKLFIECAINRNIPLSKILLFIGCNDSGGNYRTVKKIMAL